MEQKLTPIIKDSFVQFAGAVLQSRALPDVRDCMKPSARQIFYCLYTDKFIHSKPYQKTLKAIGSCFRLYIHGDSSAEGVIMRAAQPFAMRYPLVEVEGGFGTLLAAGSWPAPRYTGARLTSLAEYLFSDIQKNTIEEWRDNYDNTEQYPMVLPSKGFFNLVNGSYGIGVGASASIPQYNLRELNEALIKLLWNPDIDFDEIYCAPDFATGAILLNSNEVKNSHKEGHGFACKLRSKVDYDQKERCFIVTEIPYMVYTETICKELEEIVNSSDNPGIERFNDLTGSTPNIKIYLTRNANPDRVLKFLFKNTSLQSHYGINFTMLENGRFPKVFGWKDLLQAHLNHEIVVYTNGFKFDLNKIKDRLHIIEGLLRAYDIIDEVIQTIKTAADTKTANLALQKLLKIDEVQAKAILDLKLSRLSKIDIKKLVEEQNELEQESDRILKILHDRNLLKKEIEKGLQEVAKKFGDSRRTQILNLEQDEEEIVEVKSLIANFTNQNNLFLSETSTLYSQKRGGIGNKFKLNKDEVVTNSVLCHNIDNLLFFTQTGNVYSYEVSALPLEEKIPIESLFLISEKEKICSVVNLAKLTEEKYIIFLTKKGTIKKTNLSDYNIKRAKNGIKAIDLASNDEVVAILFTNEEQIGITSKQGNFIMIETKDIRATGRVTKGVTGMKLNEDDYVIGARVIPNDSKEVLSISTDGYIKRTLLSEFRVTGRGTKGVKLQKTDNLCDFLFLTSSSDILVTAETSQIRLKLLDIPQLNRGTQGVRAIKLPENSKITKIAIL